MFQFSCFFVQDKLIMRNKYCKLQGLWNFKFVVGTRQKSIRRYISRIWRFQGRRFNLWYQNLNFPAPDFSPGITTNYQGGTNLEKNTTPNSMSWFFKSVSKSSKMSFWTWVRKKKSWLRMCGVLERGKCSSESYFCGPKLSSAASRNLRLAQLSGKFWTAKVQKQWREIQNSNFDSHFYFRAKLRKSMDPPGKVWGRGGARVRKEHLVNGDS